MTLDEYEHDVNLLDAWRRMGVDDYRKLLLEALEQRDALAAQNMALRADLKGVDDALAALVARLRGSG